MDRRGYTIDALRKAAGVGQDAIVALRRNSWKKVSRHTLEAICATLDIDLDELFERIPEDIWTPIKMSREVTIHHGSRAFVETSDSMNGGASQVRQFVGVWDMRAMKLISEFLHRSCPDIRVRQEEHITGERGFDPEVREAADRVFQAGNHVLIGSPIANGFVEKVVCHAYEATPGAAAMRDRFPYGFVWESGRNVRSSFGWENIGDESGIWSTRTGKLVARRTTVASGEGDDCALILVYRIPQPPARRSNGDDERVIIAILGHSGVGTYAATELATDAGRCAGLYPPERRKPLMRVVSAKYSCCPVTPPRDNREVIHQELVDVADETPPTAAPTNKANRTTPKLKRRAA
jgi:DNA-binding Xre family transcriptional regulator